MADKMPAEKKSEHQVRIEDPAHHVAPLADPLLRTFVSPRPGGTGEVRVTVDTPAGAGLDTTGGVPAAQVVAAALAPHVGDVLRSVGLPLRDLEVRMLSPYSMVLTMAYMSPEPVPEKPMREAYRWLTENLQNSCGETANLLNEFTFAPGGPRREGRTLRAVVDELRQPDDANLDVRCGGHAFIVEKRAGRCRILQSYIERYSLADSLEGAAKAGTTVIATEELARSLEQIGEHHLVNHEQGRFETHPDELRLFGGPLLKATDIRDGVVHLGYKSTTGIRSAEDQRRVVNERLEQYAEEWRKVLSSTMTPLEWLSSNSG